VTLKTFPGSTLPDELRELGYDVREIGEGERILSGAIIERFTMTLCGGSTKPVASAVVHAGIITVDRYGAFARLIRVGCS
jgi:hypothetical protein